MARESYEVDRDKLRAAVRKLGNERIFSMLDDAIDLLPPSKLHKIARNYISPERLRPDPQKPTKANVLTDVKVFEKASLAGDYYESFHVNSKNYTQKSAGTCAWMAQCRRLLNQCVAEARTGRPAEVHQAMGILFGLLSRIDDCCDDIVFFADEGGSWQVDVDWERVLPAWFKVLSTSVGPEEFALQVTNLLSHHYRHGRDKMLVVAHRTATPQQRKALAQLASREAPKQG